jgi:glucan-binding YG repeat protein
MEQAKGFFEQRAAYSFIMKTLLLDEAKKQAVAVTDEDRKTQLGKMEEALKPQNKTPEQYFKESPLGEEAAKAEFEDGMIIDKLIQKNVLADIKIDDADVKKAIADVEKSNAEIAEKNKGLDADKTAKKPRSRASKSSLMAARISLSGQGEFGLPQQPKGRRFGRVRTRPDGEAL